MGRTEWVLCPVCKSKTRIKIRMDTVLENFPLFCPKCKQETLINVPRHTRCPSNVPPKMEGKARKMAVSLRFTRLAAEIKKGPKTPENQAFSSLLGSGAGGGT